jgi:hypothetical protein
MTFEEAELLTDAGVEFRLAEVLPESACTALVVYRGHW